MRLLKLREPKLPATRYYVVDSNRQLEQVCEQIALRHLDSNFSANPVMRAVFRILLTEAKSYWVFIQARVGREITEASLIYTEN